MDERLCDVCGTPLVEKQKRFCSKACNREHTDQSVKSNPLLSFHITSHHERLVKYLALRKAWRLTLGTNSRLHKKLDAFLYETLYKEWKENGRQETTSQ